jgi:alcohol dehydrogenase, propanol-preferring
MRAMLLNATAPAEETPLRAEEVPAPEPAPGQIRIRIAACGVCRTDLHTVEGDLELPRLPLIVGHQIVGHVDAVGEGVTRFAPGARVGVPWMHETCGRCPYCESERENLCGEARFTGFHADGGYAEFTGAPEGFAYPLPEGFPDLQAAPLLCAGIIGYRALRLCEIQPRGRLGLWGFGASAHVTIQVARHWGCEVFVITRAEEHREHARALGATWVGEPGERPPRSLDAAINFTPAGGTVPEGLHALRRGGTMALAGIHMSPLPAMDYALLYGERTLRSVANATKRDAEEFLALAAEIPVHTDIEVFALEEANAALLKMKRSEISGAAVLQLH